MCPDFFSNPAEAECQRGNKRSLFELNQRLTSINGVEDEQQDEAAPSW